MKIVCTDKSDLENLTPDTFFDLKWIEKTGRENIDEVDSKCLINIFDLTPYITKSTYTGFPPLSKDIYNWCLENKCHYKKVRCIYSEFCQLQWRLLFNNQESIDKFKTRWVDSIIFLGKDWGEYEFSNDWPIEYMNPRMIVEANIWMEENNIKLKMTDRSFICFETPEQAMAFKLRWI